jgi:hypothetical protein
MGDLVDLAAFREQKEKAKADADQKQTDDLILMLENFFTNNPVSTGPFYISLEHLKDYYDNDSEE